MGVLTAVYHVPGIVIEKIKKKPELMNVIECADEHEASELGLEELPPPSCDLDKSLEDVLQLGDACVHLFAPSRVKELQDLFQQVDLETISTTAVEAGATDYYGKPFDEDSASSFAEVLKGLAEFWKKAVEAGEGTIVSEG